MFPPCYSHVMQTEQLWALLLSLMFILWDLYSHCTLSISQAATWFLIKCSCSLCLILGESKVTVLTRNPVTFFTGRRYTRLCFTWYCIAPGIIIQGIPISNGNLIWFADRSYQKWEMRERLLSWGCKDFMVNLTESSCLPEIIWLVEEILISLIQVCQLAKDPIANIILIVLSHWCSLWLWYVMEATKLHFLTFSGWSIRMKNKLQN